MNGQLPVAVLSWEKNLLVQYDNLNSYLDLKEHTELPSLYSETISNEYVVYKWFC